MIIHALHALAYVLALPAPRAVRGLLTASTPHASRSVFQPCAACTVWFPHDGIDARCPCCATWQYPYARAAAKEARMKPMRAARRDTRPLCLEAVRGSGFSASGSTALSLDDEGEV